MSARIHPSSVIEKGAELGSDVSVGPFCHVAAGVSVGDGSVLVSHVSLLGPTRLGRNNRVFPFAVLGAPPQDKSWHGEPTRLEIGDDNEIREQVTVHRGTTKGGGVTRVGSRCLLMVGAHVAHDCQLADDVTLVNLASLGGHVVVAPNVVMGGHVAVAPFARVGRGAFLAGGARVERDVPPFVIMAGDRARVRALNRVGLERMGVPEPDIALLERVFARIWKSGEPVANGVAAVRAEHGAHPLVAELLAFFDP